MTQIADIPTAEVLLSRGDEAGNGGGSSQATFGYRNADAAGSEGTRGRGNGFVINSTASATYDISSLSVALAGGAGTGIRPDGDLILTIFEWTGTGATAADQANDTSDWVTKTGGTSGTQVFTGTFEVPAGTAFNGNNLLNFAFDPGELQLDDDTAYGFFMQYTLDDVTGLGADVTIAFNADLDAPDDPAGRLLNTSPVVGGPGTNGTSDTRDLNYFITGTVAGAPNAPTIAASDTLIETGSSVDLDIVFDTSADTTTLATPGGSVDLVALDDGITNGDFVANDGLVSLTESPVSTFDYVVTATKATFPDSTANVEVLVYDLTTIPADNAFSTAIKGDSPLFYYRFEEAVDSGFLLDSSVNGNHTSNIVGPFVQGGGPGGMQLAGRSDLGVGVEVPASSQMNASYTAVAVLNADNFSATNLRNVFSMTNGTGTGRSLLYYGNGGFKTFMSGATVALSDDSALPNETSCLVHMVYDADPDDNPVTIDDQEVRIYVNGLLYGSPTPIGAVASNIGDWVLCSNKTLGSQSLVGWIDESAIFEADLSDAQIAAHATAFNASADPLLGYVADTVAVSSGSPVTLTWKISDQATAVTINGAAQTISAGGIYTTVVNPTANTTYTIEVSGPGGPFTEMIDVIVFAPPEITAVSSNGASPPLITIDILGIPDTTYSIQASVVLNDGFPDPAASLMTDGAGIGTVTFTGVGSAEFYRAEQAP